jgi:Cof subfamily protein (haloacid dehalogenase superfamily)
VIPQLVATDLDGTLLRSDGTIDPRTRRAIARLEAAGIPFVLCTARPPRWMRPLAEATGHRGIAVCLNGGVIWDLHTETVIDSFPFEAEAVLDVVARLAPVLPDGAWAVESAERFGREPHYVSHWPQPDDTTVAGIEALLAEPVVKLMLRHPSLTADELLSHGHAHVGDLAELSHSSNADALLEIAAAGVTKATGLAALCAQRGVDGVDVLAFGDMPNDLAMLRWAGRAVAVANAHPDVLAAADEVTASNDDAGVARVLERLLADGSVGGAA